MSIIKAKYYYNGEKAGEVKFDSETTDPTTIDHKPEKWTTLEYNGVVIHTFFYREGDRIIGAMSPMFLGGLTARAMKLKTTFEKTGISFFEAYPGGLAKELNIKEKGYKKDSEQLIPLTEFISKNFDLKLEKHPSNWHQFDSLLAFVIGIRFNANQALFFGNEEEGGIWV